MMLNEGTLSYSSSTDSLSSNPSSPSSSSWPPATPNGSNSRLGGSSNSSKHKNKKVVTLLYYENALKSIIAQSSNQPEFKKACVSILGEISKMHQETISLHLSSIFDIGSMGGSGNRGKTSSSTHDDPLRPIKENPHRFFMPLLTALESIANVSCLRLTLDCIQKMVSNGCVSDVDVKTGVSILNAICKCFDQQAENNLDTPQGISLTKDLMNTLLCTILSCRIHGEGLQIVAQTCFSACIGCLADIEEEETQAANSSTSAIATARKECHRRSQSTLVQILSICIQRSNEESDSEDSNRYKSDVDHLLRVICNLAMKSMGSSKDETDLEVKIHWQALKILQKLWEGSEIEHYTERCDSLVKIPLVQSLLTNMVSGNLQLFKLSGDIIHLMALKDIDNMEDEVDILLRVMAHFLQRYGLPFKRYIIEWFSKLFSSNTVLVIHLFHRFDCSTTALNLFHELISTVSKLLGHKETKDAAQQFLVQLLHILRGVDMDPTTTNRFTRRHIQKKKEEYQSYLSHFNNVNEIVAIKLFKQELYVRDGNDHIALFLYSRGLNRKRVANYLCSHLDILESYLRVQSLENRGIALATYMLTMNLNLDIRIVKHDVILLEFIRKYRKENDSCRFQEADMLFLVKCIIDCIRNPKTKFEEFRESLLNYHERIFREEFVRECFTEIKTLPDTASLRIRSSNIESGGLTSIPIPEQSLTEINALFLDYVSSRTLIRVSILPEEVPYGECVRPILDMCIEAVQPLLKTPNTIEVNIDSYLMIVETCCAVSVECGLNENIHAFFSSLTNQIMVLNESEDAFKCLKLLFRMTAEYGDWLEQSWMEVLQCISYLLRTKISAAKRPGNELHYQLLHAYSVDVWPKTSLLSESGFRSFAKHLMTYLMERADQSSRLHLTTLIPEIMDYNIHRPRDEIREIWLIMCQGLSNVVVRYTSKDELLGVIASLKALSVSLLSHRLISITDIMNVFMDINSRSEKLFVRDAIVQSVGNIMVSLPASIDEMATNHIIQILAMAVKVGPVVSSQAHQLMEEKEQLDKFLVVQHAFANLAALVHQNFDIVVSSRSYRECIACIRIFLQQGEEVITIQAIELIDYIVRGLLERTAKNSDSTIESTEELTSLWIPLLHMLSVRVHTDATSNVQEYWTLSRTLKQLQPHLSPSMAQTLVDEILAPMSQSVASQQFKQEAAESISSSSPSLSVEEDYNELRSMLSDRSGSRSIHS